MQSKIADVKSEMLDSLLAWLHCRMPLISTTFQNLPPPDLIEEQNDTWPYQSHDHSAIDDMSK